MKIIGYCLLPLAVLAGMYLYQMLSRALKVFKISYMKPVVAVILTIIAAAAVLVTINYSRIGALVIYHIVVLDMIMRLADFLLRRFLPEKGKNVYMNIRKYVYMLGLVPVVITAVIMISGKIYMMHIVPTEYKVETQKEIREDGLRVLLIADVHYGISVDVEKLLIKCDEMESYDPDVVILGGDIVDESTDPDKVEEVFAALGSIESKYGTYFIFGNHDRESQDLKPKFSEEFLREKIADSGITILQDETVNLGDDFILIGRDDRYEIKKGIVRKTVAELTDGLDKSKYLICADHQPNEYADEEACGVDLVLSGHTHAGQFMAAQLFEEMVKLNDGVYGRYDLGGTTAIVTSGFGGWGYPVRNGAPSEYVIVDIVRN